MLDLSGTVSSECSEEITECTELEIWDQNRKEFLDKPEPSVSVDVTRQDQTSEYRRICRTPSSNYPAYPIIISKPDPDPSVTSSELTRTPPIFFDKKNRQSLPSHISSYCKAHRNYEGSAMTKSFDQAESDDDIQEMTDQAISELSEDFDGADLVSVLSSIWDVDYADRGITIREFVQSRLVQEIVSATQSNPHIDDVLVECLELLHPIE